MGLAPAPSSFVDPVTGAPAFGAYEGPMPAVRWPSLGFGARTLRRKKWVWAGIATEEIWIGLAVVRTGYAATAFAYAYDLAERRMLADETRIAPALASHVGDDPHARGALATFGRRVAIERTHEGFAIRAKLGKLAIDATLADGRAPTALSAIAPLGSRLANATEKRALLAVRGRARAGDRDISLDGALGGYDYTNGLMPRHTRWRWAFALGRDDAGAPIAFNFVSGFVGEAECAAFVDGRAHAMPEPRFSFDAPTSPWRLEADGIDLVFEPGAMHAQYTNLGLVRSKFIQPAGTFSGTLRVSGRDRRVERVAGVVEDQDVLW
ncbi:MAG TPA: DUF2804 family protein [Labilithrix sp.]